MALLGPRIAIIVLGLAQPARWESTFSTFIWPLLGFVFLPWTTLMYVAVAPLGVTGLDWLWLGLALVVDIGSYSGGCVRESRAHPGLHHFDAATRAQLSTR